VAAAELAQAGDELVPRQYGQAGCLLEDGDQDPVVVDRQHGDCPILRITAKAPRPLECLAKRWRCVVGHAPEPLDEPFKGVPAEPDRAIVALSRRGHQPDS
jgi:hypothetical protein